MCFAQEIIFREQKRNRLGRARVTSVPFTFLSHDRFVNAGLSIDYDYKLRARDSFIKISDRFYNV